MGGLTTSTQKAETSQKTDPWAPQAAALTKAFDAANGIYGNVSANGPAAPTDFVAGMTPEQLTTFRSMIGQGGNSAIPNQTAGTGSALQTAGTAGTAGALSGLAGFDPTSLNNASSVSDVAKQYMASQDIPGAVRAAMQSATEQARDITMPGISQNAAIGGNTNSSRTGVAEGMVQRSLAQQAGGLSTTLGNKAWTDGLALGERQASNNNAGILSALQAQGSIGNSAASGGVNASGQSLAQQGALNSTALAGGAGLQAGQQATLDNWLKQYQSGTSAPFDSLKQLMSIIGGNNWGSSSTGTQSSSSTPSAMSVIGGLMSSGGSLLGGWNGTNK